jgi:hypothetical protein
MSWKYDLYNSLFKDTVYVKVDASIDERGKSLKKRDFKIMKAFYTTRRQFHDGKMCLATKYKGKEYFLSYWNRSRFIYKKNGIDTNAEFELGMRRW